MCFYQCKTKGKGIYMKKILCLLLALVSVFAFVACGDEPPVIPSGPAELSAEEKFIDIVDSSEPTKITTLYSYVTPEEDALNARYVTEIKEGGYTFTYKKDRFATVEEAAPTPIVTDEGVVYYKDGKYSTDGETWFSEAPDVDAMSMKFDISLDNIGESYSFNEEYTELTITADNDGAKAIFGIDFAASGDITVKVSTNGKYLTMVSVSYTTASGATVTLDTSYTYNK